MTQLRACYRAAAAGPVKVMAPMVADAGDVDLLLSLAERARNELAAEGHAIGEVALGVMLEIPSAILVADSYFGRIDFASLGTNDLSQYTLAVDRGNASLERYRDSLHPSVLRLVRLAVEAAAAPASSCPCAARWPVIRPLPLALVGLGIRSLSMAGLEPAGRPASDPRRPSGGPGSGGQRRPRRARRAAAVRTRFDGLLGRWWHGVTSPVPGQLGRWFSEPGVDEADEGVDRRVLVRTVGDEADPMVARHPGRQQHQGRFGVDRTLAAAEVLDRDLRRRTPRRPP